MNEQTLKLIINATIALIGALPSLIKTIGDMDLPEQTKEELLARIKAAQDSLPEW